MNLKNGWRFWKMDGGAAAILVGLTLIAYFVQISPTLSRREEARAQGEQLAADREKSRQLERSVLTTKDQLEKTRKAAANSQINLDPATAVNERLARLTELAARNFLQLDGIESGASSTYPRYSTLVIKITGRGSYQNCAATITQLRKQMPDVGIESLRMTSTGDTSDKNANFVMELLWYTQVQAKPTKN